MSVDLILQQTSDILSIFINLAFFILIILVIFSVILIIPFQLVRGMLKTLSKTLGELFE